MITLNADHIQTKECLYIIFIVFLAMEVIRERNIEILN